MKVVLVGGATLEVIMADWNDPATWAQGYDIIGGFPGVAGFGDRLSYLDGRTYALHLARDGGTGLAAYRLRLQKLGAGGFSPAAETLIVGCGFGWLIEVLVDIGANNVWGSDISTPIQTGLIDSSVGVRADIQALVLDIDFTAPNAKSLFKAVNAGNKSGAFRNVVTEHLLEDWPIEDIDTALDACDNLRAQGQSTVYHMITAMDSLDSSLVDSEIAPNRFNLSEWAALRSEHFWIDIVTGNIAGGV